MRGSIVAQQKVAIAESDSALSLHRKLCAASQTLLHDALLQIYENRTHERKQDESQATYVGRRTPEDGRLEWEKTRERAT